MNSGVLPIQKMPSVTVCQFVVNRVHRRSTGVLTGVTQNRCVDCRNGRAVTGSFGRGGCRIKRRAGVVLNAETTKTSTNSRTPDEPITTDLEKLANTMMLGMIVTLSGSLYNGTLFAWHPICMSMGYIGLMTKGVIAGIKFRSLQGQDRVDAIQTHALMQVGASALIAGGFTAIYKNKVLLGKPHFTSLHSKVGLATVLLSVVAPVVGAVAFRKLGFIQMFPESFQPKIKWFHRNVGAIAWFLSLVTVFLALSHPVVAKGALNRFWQVGLVTIGASVVGLMKALEVAPNKPPSTNSVPAEIAVEANVEENS